MKEAIFVGSSLRDLRKFPEEARSEAGHAVYLAQKGEKAVNAVPLAGFGGAAVLEIVIPEGGDAFRAVYTVKFDTAIYVLHAFQKKSKRGAKTPLQDMNLVRSRLNDAREIHQAKKRVQLEKKNEQGSG
jgi:phage-related protein